MFFPESPNSEAWRKSFFNSIFHQTVEMEEATERIMMRHRHLNLTPETEFCLPAIDDIICYGGWADWAELRIGVLRDQIVRDDVEHMCGFYLSDPYAHRYHFWNNYVQNLKTSP